MKALYPCDLHTHSTRSDGCDTIPELIQRAAKCGIRILGIADHDVLPISSIEIDGEMTDIIQYAQIHSVCLIHGVEFSCETMVEDVHVIGYGCCWTHPALLELEAFCTASKMKAYKATLDRLTEFGFPLKLEEVLQQPGGRIDPDKLQKKHIFEAMAKKGYFLDWITAKLFVRDHPSLNVKRQKPEAVRVIQVIQEADGLAVLAHPYLIDETITTQSGKFINRGDFIHLLQVQGLNGIESRYPYDKTTCKDRRPNFVLWREIFEQYKDTLLLSGGSDYHADQKRGSKNPRMLGECGLTMEEFFIQPAFKNLLSNEQLALFEF